MIANWHLKLLNIKFMTKQFESAPAGVKGEQREIIPDSKVGLSLSFCIADILRGNVAEIEVKEIISGTKAADEKSFNDVVEIYKGSYWHINPEEGEAIAKRLYAAGKIKQPRLEKEVDHNISDGHWIEPDQAEAWVLKRRFHVGESVMFEGVEYQIESINVDKLEAEISTGADISLKTVSLRDLTEAK